MKEFLKKIVGVAENVGTVVAVISALSSAILVFVDKVKYLAEDDKKTENE